MPTSSYSSQKLLIANRGEIALRVISSAQGLGVPTLAVYTEIDASSPHVVRATEAVLIPNYLDIDALISVCKSRGVTMVHPGYGFLSENEGFAAAVEAAGVVFLGPTPTQIGSMGLKHEARARAIAAKVPVLPGSELVATLDDALAQAEQVGWPIMLKATGGGGGRGTAVCTSEAELRANWQSTVEMTETLFGGGLFVEKFVPRARHIEVQVVGDGKGGVIHCGERECSAQRRHQKVLEEATSPFVDAHPEVGQAMYTAAVALCKLISYRSAGTVEFLVDDNTAKFYFLELNSRIQVEHAVTEMVRPGLDLVAIMIRIGLSQLTGEPFFLPPQEQVAPAHGHAIEARVYAEVPHLAFAPAPGLLTKVVWPKGDHVRVDTWVETGTTVSSHYDPMIGKLIVHGETREEARIRLSQALADTVLLGTATNLAYLRTIVDDKEFANGTITTKYLDTFPYSHSCIEVVDGGLSTTVQDGRPRLPSGGDGIPRGGPMDPWSARAANVLVGNPAETEVLEITLAGPTLKFATSTVVAVCGAEADIFLEDTFKPTWTRFVVPAGCSLEIGACEHAGKTAYLAIKGGLPSVPLHLESKSTFSPGKIGGVQGRELAAGDILDLAAEAGPSVGQEDDLTLPLGARPQHPHQWTLAALPGPHADTSYLHPDDLATLYSTTYTVSPDSNRLGLRLSGLKPLEYAPSAGGGGHGSNVTDHGYANGMLNMNGDLPVLFAADAPDCGGLACPVTLVECEQWKTGQLKAGDTFRFVVPAEGELSKHAAKQAEWLGSVKAFAAGGEEVPGLFPLDLGAAEGAPPDGVLHKVEDGADSPSFKFLQAGDGAILIEVGDQNELTFRTRLLTELWERRLRDRALPGLYAYIQNVASLLVKFHPAQLSQAEVLAALLATSAGLAEASVKSDVPSRRLHLPVVFNDSVSKETVQRYMTSTKRTRAVFLPDNLEYMARACGVNGADEVVGRFLSSDWFCTSRSFFLGLPFLFPLDKRALLAAQKYNPTRTFTPSGTLGYAGNQCAIYPTVLPGGYQILGRTLTPWSAYGRYGKGHEGHFLIRSFDLIRWVPMGEGEFGEVEKAFAAGSWQPKVEAVTISAREMAEMEERTKEEARAIAVGYQANLDALAVEESAYVREYQAQLDAAKAEGDAAAEAAAASKASGAGDGGGAAGGSGGGGAPLKSPVMAAVRSIGVVVGDVLTKETVPAKVEAMKTEIVVRVPRGLLGRTVTRVCVQVGETVQPGQALLYAE